MSDTRDVDMDMDTDTSCPICNAEFLDSEDLSVHMEQHSQQGKSSWTRYCNTCHTKFPDAEYYALHIINNHLSTAVSCRYCTRVFYDRNKLKQHAQKHSSTLSTALSCSQCDILFYSSKELEVHEFNEHVDVEEGIMLQKCFPILSSLLNMNIRRFFAVPYENYLYSCVGCSIATHSVDKYIKHLQIENVKSFSCEGCCSVFNCKYNIKRHIQNRPQCRNFLKPNFKERCENCKKFIDEALYKKHIKLCHAAMYIKTSDSPLIRENSALLQTCKFCHRPFVGSDAIKKHIERTHMNSLHLYKYLCIQCDVVFKHPKMLFSHYFTKHKDLKPYTCLMCNEKFRIRKTFTLHIKLNHKSIGYVEFDENYHVFFTDKKSEIPFQPQSQHAEEFIMVNGTTAIKRNSITSIKKSPDDEFQKEEEMENEPQDQSTTDIEDSKDAYHSIDKKKYKNSSSKNQIASFKKGNKINEDKNDALLQVLETDGDLTDIESKSKPVKRIKKDLVQRKSRKAKFESTIEIFDSDPSSDDSSMPLLSLKNRIKSKKPKNRKQFKILQSYIPKNYKFRCGVCNKNCYTYQNYHYHLSLHKKNKRKKCIKCNETFKSKSALADHMQAVHSSSQLTETLKQLIERRKNNIYIPKDQKTIAEGLRKTIKKIKVEKDSVSATITPVDNKLSVKNFLENFTPDTDSTPKDVTINTTVSIKIIDEITRSPLIKMTKFNREITNTKAKPRMPVKFKADRESEKVKVSIKLAQGPVNKPNLRFTHQIAQIDHSYSDLNDVRNEIHNDSEIHYENEVHYDNDVHQDHDGIPEVAEEVMLNTEDKVQQNIIIPNLPNYPNIRIAHLQSQAPFYKIIKLNEIAKPNKTEKPQSLDNITLPDGTKLVTVNPLAHLMGNTSMEEIFKANKKNYEPRCRDIKSAIFKALEAKNKVYYKKKNTSATNSTFDNILSN